MNNKLVIRRLPPSIGEDEFLKQVSPLPEHDYFCFFDANPSLGSHAFSRAYINFIKPEDMSIFRDRFDNYVFLDRNGHEYPAVVEQSLWHKSPRNGPFYRSPESLGASHAILEHDKKTAAPRKNVDEDQETPSGLEQDLDFIEFVERIKNPKKRNQQSPIETLENHLDAITNAASSNAKNNNGKNKIIPPLTGFVNQRRLANNTKKRGK